MRTLLCRTVLTYRLFFQAPLLRKRQACRPFLPFLPPQLELEALEDMADTRHLQSGSRHALVCVGGISVLLTR